MYIVSIWVVCVCARARTRWRKKGRMRTRTAVKNSDSLLKFRYLLCGWLCAGDLVEAPFINVTSILLRRRCRSCFQWSLFFFSPVRLFGSELHWTSCSSIPRDERAQWVFNISFFISVCFIFCRREMICLVANARLENWIKKVQLYSILILESVGSFGSRWYKSSFNTRNVLQNSIFSRCIY